MSKIELSGIVSLSLSFTASTSRFSLNRMRPFIGSARRSLSELNLATKSAMTDSDIRYCTYRRAILERFVPVSSRKTNVTSSVSAENGAFSKYTAGILVVGLSPAVCRHGRSVRHTSAVCQPVARSVPAFDVARDVDERRVRRVGRGVDDPFARTAQAIGVPGPEHVESERVARIETVSVEIR